MDGKIIAISGSVGSGKTTISDLLGEKLGCKVIHLNELAKKYKLEDVARKQTFDFDLAKLLEDFEKDLIKIKQAGGSVIVESHFAHFISPEIVDILFIINRDQKELEGVYDERDYDFEKIRDNLEAENFNVCFYEAIEEGYEEEKQVFAIENCDLNESLNSIFEFICDS